MTERELIPMTPEQSVAIINRTHRYIEAKLSMVVDKQHRKSLEQAAALLRGEIPLFIAELEHKERLALQPS